jgi:5-methylcytosine-specific restriction enzyme A
VPRLPCIVCGQLTNGSRCPLHDRDKGRKRDTPGRGGPAVIRDYRARALARDGNRCRALLDDGTRCTAALPERLEVHHVRPLVDGGSHSTANLVTLCPRHHHVIEAVLRSAAHSPGE